MNNHHGEKYRETHQQIFDAALEMLQNKDITLLRVSHICSKLSINRSTFYDHFEDIYDMFSKLEAQMQLEMSSQFEQKKTTSIQDAFHAVFHVIRSHQTFYTYYLSHGGVVSLSQVLIHKLLCLQEERLFEKQRLDMAYQFDFIIFGFNAMLKRWVLERNCCREDEPYLIARMMVLWGRGQGVI